jgi:trehalose-6-phosphate synthase
MCKQIMWPMFHYVLPMSPTSNARFDPNLWQVSKNLSIRSSRSNHATAVR